MQDETYKFLSDHQTPSDRALLYDRMTRGEVYDTPDGTYKVTDDIIERSSQLTQLAASALSLASYLEFRRGNYTHDEAMTASHDVYVTCLESMGWA